MQPATPVHRAILASVILWILIAGVVRPALCAARVEGGVDAITVEARDATLAEVFAAMSAHVGLRLRLSNADHQRVDGRFQGPLRRVVARLLAGRNYIARYSNGAVEILVLGPSSTAPTAAASAAPTTASTAAQADRLSPAPPSARHGRRTRNEAALAAVRAAQRTTGAGGGEASGPPSE